MSLHRSVLVIGKSRLVLDEAVAGLRDLGYEAEATNDFSDIMGRFDFSEIDLVVFGGKVPPDLRAELTERISRVNPRAILIGGLSGIAGLIINQVQGEFAAVDRAPTQVPTYTPESRTIELILPEPADVKVTLWWRIPSAGPDPASDSLVVIDGRLSGGRHPFAVPGHIPARVAFASVQVDDIVHNFSIATEE